MAAISNLVVTHAETGLVHAEVVNAAQISPHFVRLTLAGDDLRGLAPPRVRPVVPARRADLG